MAGNCAWPVLSTEISFNLNIPKGTRFVEGLGEKNTWFLEASCIVHFVNMPSPQKGFFFSPPSKQAEILRALDIFDNCSAHPRSASAFLIISAGL